ncbi:MAG TPA: choice-of-anchor Q domain-containing protein, partial [Candidatus Saccharimonadales bacterium]|nr:choice-of-anchor Q domain-containing protein [Candidatus Saccharimonadales bacterium]
MAISNTTFFGNRAQAANGTGLFTKGSGGSSLGGAVCTEGGSTWLGNVTVSQNGVFGGKGSPNGAAEGSGVFATNGSATLHNSILTSALNGSNSFGNILDGGYNINSDTSGNFTNIGSMNNIDPLLGPLQNNGGPSLTLALTDCSPGVEAGDPAMFPSADQRGILRPQGTRSDIGAVEGIVTWYHTLFSFAGQDVQLQ